MSLSDYLQQARKTHTAVGHFNFSTADVLRAIVEGAKEGGAPAVMVGTSEGEADFLGVKETVALVKAMREEYDFPVFLNADHFKSFEKCQEAIDAGYDTVLIDASKMPFEENVALTKKVKDFAAGKAEVEGELGYLRGSSEVQEAVEITPGDYTKPEEALTFVQQTNVDRLAVVFGNIHGILTKQEENLDIEHLKNIVAVVPDVALVLHGASGLPDEQVSAAIKAGIVNVHFNTELRVAYTKGIEKGLHPPAGGKPGETTPYKYLGPAADEVKKVVMQKVQLFMM